MSKFQGQFGKAPDLSKYVPFTGAPTDVDLGSNNIYAANLSGNTDGGFANSVYLAVQLIDGGGA